MTGRAFAFASALLIGALGAYGAGSCTPTPTITPVGTAESVTSFAISSPRPGECVAVSDPANDTVPVALATIALNLGQGQFAIHPPGACDSIYNCGHIRLYVDGILNNEGAGPIIDLLLRKEADPYRQMTATVEIVDDCGNPWLPSWNNIILDQSNDELPVASVGFIQDGGLLCLPGPDGGPSPILAPGYADAGFLPNGPYLASVTFTTAASCGGSGTGGATSASASSSGGTGGASSASASSSGGTGGAGTGGASSASASSSGGTGGAGTGGASSSSSASSSGSVGDAGTDAGDGGDGG